MRVRLEPSNGIDGFLETLGAMEYRLGFPKPVAGARFVRDHAANGYAAWPSLNAQQRLAGAVLKLADTEYTFVDEWDVNADPETVFDILADGHTYPEWWKPVYIGVRQEGEYTLPALQGPPALPPAHAHEDDRGGPAAPDPRRDRRRPARDRHLDAHADGHRRAPTSASTGRSTPTAGC